MVHGIKSVGKKSQNFLITHIGSSEGFLENGLQTSKSKETGK